MDVKGFHSLGRRTHGYTHSSKACGFNSVEEKRPSFKTSFRDILLTSSSAVRSSKVHSRKENHMKVANPVQPELEKTSKVVSSVEFHFKEVKPMDFKSALLQGLTDQNTKVSRSEIKSKVICSPFPGKDNNSNLSPVKQVDSVVFNRDNQPVYSLTLNHGICRTCGPLSNHDMVSCCPFEQREVIIRPSRREIWNHPLVQKNLKNNGFSDAEDDEDEDSEVIQIMKRAATFVPNKNPDIGNRAYKRPALIEYEKRMMKYEQDYENEKSKREDIVHTANRKVLFNSPEINYHSYRTKEKPYYYTRKYSLASENAKPAPRDWKDEFGFTQGPRKVPTQNADLSEAWDLDEYY